MQVGENTHLFSEFFVDPNMYSNDSQEAKKPRHQNDSDCLSITLAAELWYNQQVKKAANQYWLHFSQQVIIGCWQSLKETEK